jgi:hypothetical protein
MIESLQLYKMEGGALEFQIGASTNVGIITKIEELPSGFFKIHYDTGRYGVFSGFYGVGKIYAIPKAKRLKR